MLDSVAWEDKCFDSLASGRLDFVMNADEGNVPPSFECEAIYRDKFCCVVDADSKYARDLTLKQYLNANHIGVTVFGSSQVIPEKRLAAIEKNTE